MLRLMLTVWELGPTLYFTKSARGSLEEMWGSNPRLDIIVEEERVKLCLTETGPHILGSTDSADWPFRLTCANRDYEGVRCGPLIGMFTQSGGDLCAPIPLPHERPWSHYQEHENGPFDKHEAAVREIRLRQDSLKRHEGHRRLTLSPHVQLLLTSEERVQYFQEHKI